MLSSLGERLGWKRDKIGPSELGCGPLPQVIFVSPAMRAGTAAGLSHAARRRLLLPAVVPGDPHDLYRHPTWAPATDKHESQRKGSKGVDA